jgi:hypothetical protein
VAISSLMGGLGGAYKRGAASGFNNVNNRARAYGIKIGNFNNLMDVGISDRKAVVELADLKALEEALKDVGPNFHRKFKRDAKKVGEPARDAVRKTFRTVGAAGPLGIPKRKGRIYDRMATSTLGRLSWQNSRMMNENKSIDVNYKNRREGQALARLKAAGDGTISIVRVRVMAPAYIVADMAGRSGNANSGGALTRKYQINLFGRGEVTRDHTVNATNVSNWIKSLDKKATARQQDFPSRYAWPTLIKHAPKFRADASKLLNESISMLNRRMAR